MKDLKFHYAKAKNVFCFGEEGVEFFFDEYGKVVVIKGENFDEVDEDNKPGSNGSGKSSVQEIICLALFGDSVKDKLKNANIIHNKAKDDAYLEVIWDDYRVVRTIGVDSNKTTVKVWESKDHIWDKTTELTKGKGKISTQELIEDKLGFNYRSFINVTIFDDSNQYAFLESDTPTKREIVENLLYLKQYTTYCANAKKLHKKQNEKIKLLGKLFDNIKAVIEYAKKRLLTTQTSDLAWVDKKKNEIQKLENELKEKQLKLEKADFSSEMEVYNNAQKQISEITDVLIPNIENNKLKILEIVNEANSKIVDLKNKAQSIADVLNDSKIAITSYKKTIKENEDLIADVSNLKEGQKCPTCYGIIDKNGSKSVLEHTEKKLDSIQKLLIKEFDFYERNNESYKVVSDNIKKIQTSIDLASDKIKSYDKKIEGLRKELQKLSGMQKPQLEADLLVLEQAIIQTKKLLQNNKDELERGSPYKEIIEDAKKHLSEKLLEEKEMSDKIKEAELAIKYITYWEKAFGDDGIRKMIIDKIIPSLNDRIAYWLQFLLDNRITLKFDSSLDVTIERNPVNGNPFVYNALSRGEKRKLNLAISQAFSYITLLSRGSQPSVLFLDEVGGGNIDANGIPGVYSMICELSKERQVFVTTHDQNLLNLLQGFENIVLRKKDGVTKIMT